MRRFACRLRQRTAGHRERQLDVVRRVGGDEVDAVGLQVGQQREGIAAAHSDPARVERALAARIGSAEIGEQRAGAVPLAEEVAHDRLVDRDPARIELEAECPARPAGDRRAEQRPADSGERVEDELAGSA